MNISFIAKQYLFIIFQISNVGVENEILTDDKGTSDYEDAQKPYDEGYVSNKKEYFQMKRRRRYSKHFPAFSVIKCIVEQMSTSKKGNQFTSLENRNLKDTICKERYKRHHRRREYTDIVLKKGRYAAHPIAANLQSNVIDQFDTRTMPNMEDNCTVISSFLTHSSNLELIRGKTEALSCEEGNMSNTFDRFAKLTNTRVIGTSRRVKIVRKWRHLGCHLYRRFLDCVKRSFSSRNATVSPTERTIQNSITTQTNPSGGSSIHDPDQEAVHVSDSSHFDFLNFMIGYNYNDVNDYQMWFY